MTGMKDIIREMPMKPDKGKADSNGLFSQWYKCPVCHDTLDYKQEMCVWCGKKINWDCEPE